MIFQMRMSELLLQKFQDIRILSRARKNKVGEVESMRTGGGERESNFRDRTLWTVPNVTIEVWIEFPNLGCCIFKTRLSWKGFYGALFISLMTSKNLKNNDSTGNCLFWLLQDTNCNTFDSCHVYFNQCLVLFTQTTGVSRISQWKGVWRRSGVKARGSGGENPSAGRFL